MFLVSFRICNFVYYEICICLGHGFYEIEIIFFNKVCLIINTFPPLCETLFAGCVKALPDELEIFTHAVFRLVIVDKTTISGLILQGAKKVEVGGC